MGILSMSEAIVELKSGTVPQHKKYVFKFFSPIVFIINSGFFAALIFGHRAINYLITSLVGEIDVQINFYHVWSYGVIGAAIILSILGIGFCWWVNIRETDGKDFWNRLVTLGFIVRCHILLYSVIAVILVGIFSNLHFTKKVGNFTESIYPELRKPVQVEKHRKHGRGSVTHALRSPGATGFLPLVPSRFKVFFKQLTQILLWMYQLLSLLPLVLVITHYLFIGYLLKNNFGNKKSA